MKKIKNKFLSFFKKKKILICSITSIFIIVLIAILVFYNKHETYSISIDTNGGNALSSSPLIKDGKITTPPNPTKPGFTFVEWQVDGILYDFNQKLTSNIILTAIWKAGEDTVIVVVHFDSAGGSDVSVIEVSSVVINSLFSNSI